MFKKHLTVRQNLKVILRIQNSKENIDITKVFAPTEISER